MERDLSVPHHVQALERFLNISRLLSEVENVMVDPIPTFKYSWNINGENATSSDSFLLDRDLKPDEKYIYDTSELNEDNMWLKDILLSDSSDSSDEEEMSEEEMKRMLKKHKQMKKIREKTRQQPSSYSGYSTSILASDNPAFHFEFPSLDYSNKTRREKRPIGRRNPSKESEPLTISDMIDALHSHCVSEEKGITPPQLLIECDGPVLKKPRYARTTSQIWRNAIVEVVKRAQHRLARLDQQQCFTSKLCDEIRAKSGELLKNLKHTGKLDVAEESNTEESDQQESSITLESLPSNDTESKLDCKSSPTQNITLVPTPDVSEEPQELSAEEQSESKSNVDSLNQVEGVEQTTTPIDNNIENSSSTENIVSDLSGGENS
ncbi:hypothetical protein ACHWQZ_G002449 [Mnemiopsis leidyi]